MQINRKKELQNKVTSGFLGFWIRNFRLSYLATAVVILLGLSAIFQIPKESMPEVDLGTITITTIYPGANPQDIDTQITDKIYKEIKDVDGVDKITSTSSVGVSSLVVSVKTGFEAKDVRTDIASKVDSVSLPSDAKTPNINLLETSANMTFSMYLYHKNNESSKEELIERAMNLKKQLESLPQIESVSIALNPNSGGIGSSSDDSDYKVEFIIKNETLSAYGLTLGDISNQISAFNIDIPIGNFSIENKKYDYRISGKNTNAIDFLKIPIRLPSGEQIALGDIASIHREYIADKNAIIMTAENNFQERDAIGLIVSKTDSASIFGAANATKEKISKIFEEQGFREYLYFYTSDIADVITTDYVDLLWNFLSTLTLVFIIMFFFVGFVDSLFATLVLPLSFLATFIMLNSIGFTMNILTNFSLIIALGIAIDTIIVFVQAASAKIRVGYDPQTAIILAFKEYAMSIIVGTLTTIMVFIPIMSLPGIMGRFLAFIPVTIFGVLFFGLLFALTINGALYKAIIRPKKTYIEDATTLEYATPEQRELLILEREGKILTQKNHTSLRERMVAKLTEKYKNLMDKNIRKKSFRIFAILLPVLFFFLGIKFIAPLINFELMPADDNNEITYTIKAEAGINTLAMNEKISEIPEFFKNFSEIKNISIVTADNQVDININLIDKAIRQKKGQMSAFDLDKKIFQKLENLKTKGLDISGGVVANGPSSGGDVGIKIQSSSSDNLSELIRVAKDFEDYISSLSETKNITNSSEDTPGQFIFELKKDLLTHKGISAQQIYSAITSYTNGLKVANIDDNGKEIDIILKNEKFQENITPDMIADIPLTTPNGTFRIGDFISIKTENAIASISRENGNIQMSIGADIIDGANSIAVTQKILDFAEKYNFPENISYNSGGAQSENSDLIISMITSLLLAMIGIFAVLTWQFQSYAKPAIVFYSVIMALPFVLLGLFVTGNPFSLMFGIGFIALMGISVNHGIILLEGVDQNLEKGMGGFQALIESSASRLEPMLLTTLTTVLGMIPLAMTGAMWAGLAWTIIFGLMATTFIALFSLGPLYYELFIKEKNSNRPGFFKRIFSKFSSLHFGKNFFKKFQKKSFKIKSHKNASSLKTHYKQKILNIL